MYNTRFKRPYLFNKKSKKIFFKYQFLLKMHPFLAEIKGTIYVLLLTLITKFQSEISQYLDKPESRLAILLSTIPIKVTFFLLQMSPHDLQGILCFYFHIQCLIKIVISFYVSILLFIQISWRDESFASLFSLLIIFSRVTNSTRYCYLVFFSF